MGQNGPFVQRVVKLSFVEGFKCRNYLVIFLAKIFYPPQDLILLIFKNYAEYFPGPLTCWQETRGYGLRSLLFWRHRLTACVTKSSRFHFSYEKPHAWSSAAKTNILDCFTFGLYARKYHDIGNISATFLSISFTFNISHFHLRYIQEVSEPKRDNSRQFQDHLPPSITVAPRTQVYVN